MIHCNPYLLLLLTEIATTPTEENYNQATEEENSPATDTGFHSGRTRTNLDDDDGAGIAIILKRHFLRFLLNQIMYLLKRKFQMEKW